MSSSRKPSSSIYTLPHGQHHITYTLASSTENTLSSNNTLFASSAATSPTPSTTLIFLHGYGDSSDNFIDFLNNDALKKYNILIADHLGHGLSQCDSTSTDYSVDFVKAKNIPHQHISTDSHWVWMENKPEFIQLLEKFIAVTLQNKNASMRLWKIQKKD
jgi:hypothetical protein